MFYGQTSKASVDSNSESDEILYPFDTGHAPSASAHVCQFLGSRLQSGAYHCICLQWRCPCAAIALVSCGSPAVAMICIVWLSQSVFKPRFAIRDATSHITCRKHACRASLSSQTLCKNVDHISSGNSALVTQFVPLTSVCPARSSWQARSTSTFAGIIMQACTTKLAVQQVSLNRTKPATARRSHVSIQATANVKSASRR